MNNNAQQIAFSFNGLAQGTSTTFNAYSVDYNTDTTRYEERDPRSKWCVYYCLQK